MADSQFLITPGEVVSLAFAPGTAPTADAVAPTVILSCQEKFVKPVLGGLYDALLTGKYPDLLDGYIKPALAGYVKYALVPHLAYSLAEAGVTVLKSPHLEACSEKELGLLRKTFRAEATALMRRAVDHIESDGAAYPEYDPRKNVLHRVGISSQFVI